MSLFGSKTQNQPKIEEEEKRIAQNNAEEEEIERIVVFFKNGTFKNYKP